VLEGTKKPTPSQKQQHKKPPFLFKKKEKEKTSSLRVLKIKGD